MRQPFRCPVCHGEGKRWRQTQTTAGMVEEPCYACDRSGIVWSPDDGKVNPYRSPLTTSVPVMPEKANDSAS